LQNAQNKFCENEEKIKEAEKKLKERQENLKENAEHFQETLKAKQYQFEKFFKEQRRTKKTALREEKLNMVKHITSAGWSRSTILFRESRRFWDR